jgi:hypothetical protein
MTRTAYIFFPNSYPKAQKSNPCEHHHVRQIFRIVKKKDVDTKYNLFLRILPLDTKHEILTKRTTRYTSFLHRFLQEDDQPVEPVEIKLKQYVLIAKAGLAVVESKEKGMNSIEDYLLVFY